MREKAIRSEIVEGKAQVAQMLSEISKFAEAVAAAEQEVVDKDEEYEGTLAAKIKQLQSLEVCSRVIFHPPLLTIPRSH